MSTIKQQKVAKILLENGGGVSAAMREAGYGNGTAKNPQKFTRSKGWQQLMEKYLPDALVVQRHRELLDKEEILHVGEKTITQPHSDVLRALDMVYKLKGNYSSDKHLNVQGSLREALDMLDEYKTQKGQ